MKYIPQRQNWRLLSEKIEKTINSLDQSESSKKITITEPITNKETVIVYPSPAYLLIPLNYYWKIPRHENLNLKAKLSSDLTNHSANPSQLPINILLVSENLDLFDEEKNF